jgi:antitoxin (DNA-binding transcriptional repressor) of toxin-antitoxin stability system
VKRGRPVARIVPAEPAGSAEQAAAIDAIIAFSKTVKVKGKVNLRRAIASGRL